MENVTLLLAEDEALLLLEFDRRSPTRDLRGRCYGKSRRTAVNSSEDVAGAAASTYASGSGAEPLSL